MDFSSFSLLYPDAETLGAHFAGKDQPDIAPEVLDQLGLSENPQPRSDRSLYLKSVGHPVSRGDLCGYDGKRLSVRNARKIGSGAP